MNLSFLIATMEATVVSVSSGYCKEWMSPDRKSTAKPCGHRKGSLVVYHQLWLDLLPNRHWVSSHLPGKPTFSRLHFRYLSMGPKGLEIFLNHLYLLSYVYGCFCLHVCLSTMWLQSLQRPEDGIKTPRSGVRNGLEPSHGCWILNSGPLEE